MGPKRLLIHDVDGDEYLPFSQAADYLGMARSSLDASRRNGQYPGRLEVMVDGRRYYRKQDLDGYLSGTLSEYRGNLKCAVCAEPLSNHRITEPCLPIMGSAQKSPISGRIR